MSKLFVSDLDGTLLRKNHTIDEKDWRSLKMLKDKGYKIALSTGRLFSSVQAIGKPLGLVDYYIANNGSVITRGDEILFEDPIPHDKLKRIIEIANQKSYIYHMYDLYTFYTNVFDAKRLEHLKIKGTDKYQVKIRSHENIIDAIIEEKIPIYKIMLHMSFEEDRETVRKLKEIGGLSLFMSGNMSSDIMNEGVSKAKALEHLQEKLSFKFDKIVAIGDHENDIGMIEAADIGIAMGNAIDKLKIASDYVTDSNDNDGFYKAIQYVLEGEKDV